MNSNRVANIYRASGESHPTARLEKVKSPVGNILMSQASSEYHVTFVLSGVA